MDKKNCWEIKNCGREPGGCKVDEMGICPSSTSEEFNGVNNGSNAGRFCWNIVGTLCTGKVLGTFAQKFKNCLDCNFFKLVRKEETDDFRLSAFDVNKRKIKSDNKDSI